MLALRLARGTHPLVLLRRLLVSAASGRGRVPAAVHARLRGRPPAAASRAAAAVVRGPAGGHGALRGRGGPHRPEHPAARRDCPRWAWARPGSTAIAAASTAVSCTLGSAVALLVFLHLRGDITGLPFDGAAAGLLAADQPMPLAGALTLLAVLPVTASVAAGLALRPRTRRPGDGSDPVHPEEPAPAPSGLPWGVRARRGGPRGRDVREPGRPGLGLPDAGPLRGQPGRGARRAGR